MKILLDTNYLIWVSENKVPPKAKVYLEDKNNDLYFSAISIWETAIKTGTSPDFKTVPFVLRLELIDNGYTELPLTSLHSLLVNDLPPIHKDPFDRILIAQAKMEGMLFLTADKVIKRYSGDAPILYVPLKRIDRERRVPLLG